MPVLAWTSVLDLRPPVATMPTHLPQAYLTLRMRARTEAGPLLQPEVSSAQMHGCGACARRLGGGCILTHHYPVVVRGGVRRACWYARAAVDGRLLLRKVASVPGGRGGGEHGGRFSAISCWDTQLGDGARLRERPQVRHSAACSWPPLTRPTCRTRPSPGECVLEGSAPPAMSMRSTYRA